MPEYTSERLPGMNPICRIMLSKKRSDTMSEKISDRYAVRIYVGNYATGGDHTK